MTVMKNNHASKRAAELVHQALDVLQRVDRAPSSPLHEFLQAKQRREFRRRAMRLRMGKTQPRYQNLHTAEELAGIYERTARRDEILEQAFKDFRQITLELGVLEENDPEVGKTLDAVVAEIKQSAKENGPGSEAAQRFRYLRMLGWFGQQSHSHKRRRRAPTPKRVPLASDPTVAIRNRMYAAEILDSPPSPDETAIAIPPEGRDSGRGRILIRIGIGEWSWVGSFACGNHHSSTVLLMPDGKHLFVSAAGAGYIIDAKTRTLVEELGTEVVRAMSDEPMTLLIVNHNDLCLEAFGKTGRLWKTRPIGSGGIRGMELTNDTLIGEVRHPFRPGWTGFAVNLATGDVYLNGF